MREIIIGALLTLQKRIKTDTVLSWHEYEFAHNENLRETLDLMDDLKLFETYNKIYKTYDHRNYMSSYMTDLKG